jgi:hypothetical protein
MSEEGRTFQGVILLDIDLLNRGRYKVHIDELHSHLANSDGIWCRNKTHPWKYNTDFNLGAYGSYYPLQPGTRVIVTFVDRNYEKGDIVAISADQEEFALPLWCTPEARDHVTMLYRTPYYNNIYQINEFPLIPSLTDQPKNSIHSYFNCDIGPSPLGKDFCGDNDPKTASKTKIRTKYIINEDGVHFQTADNLYVTVDTDGHIAINGKTMIKLKNDVDVHIEGDHSTKLLIDGTVDVHIKKATKVMIDKDCDIVLNGDNKISSYGKLEVYSLDTINVWSDSNINIQGGSDINLNCGTSAVLATEPKDAKDTKGYNEKEPEDKELTGMKRVLDIAAAAAKTAAKLG